MRSSETPDMIPWKRHYNEIANPINNAVTNTGAHIFAAMVIACSASSTICVSVMPHPSEPHPKGR